MAHASLGLVDTFSDVVLSLHRASRELPVEAFQDWALERVKKLIHFDSAFWGGGREPADNVVLHYVHMHNQPDEMTLAWERCKDKAGDLVGKLMESAGTSMLINGDILRYHDSYPLLWKRYGVEHILSVYVRDPVALLYHCISFYRSGKSGPFTETERLFHQSLVPHMIEAHRNNRLMHMEARSVARAPIVQWTAAADGQGVLHFAQPGFVSLVSDEWGNWRGPQLPQKLLPLLAKESGARQYAGKEIVFSAVMLHDLFVVQARRKQVADQLSERLMQVARLFAKGETHKEIARKLELSPATVRNQVSSIYRRLGIGNKAELVNVLGKVDIMGARE